MRIRTRIRVPIWMRAADASSDVLHSGRRSRSARLLGEISQALENIVASEPKIRMPAAAKAMMRLAFESPSMSCSIWP